MLPPGSNTVTEAPPNDQESSTVREAPPSDQESSSDTELRFSLHTLDTAHLKEYDCSVKPRRRKGKGGNNSRKTEPKQEEQSVMGEAAKLWLEVGQYH